NCKTCGCTHVGSWKVFSAQPTVWPRSLLPVGKLFVPPSVRSARILPVHGSQTNPRHTLKLGLARKKPQLQPSLFGSSSSISEMPATIPRCFFTAPSPVLLRPGPEPSVPRSVCCPNAHPLACRALFGSVYLPATVPKLSTLRPAAPALLRIVTR